MAFCDRAPVLSEHHSHPGGLLNTRSRPGRMGVGPGNGYLTSIWEEGAREFDENENLLI